MVTLAISTIGTRVENLLLPEPRVGMEYLILVQAANHPIITLFQGRCDVRLVILESLGLSKSRNAALELAKSDLIVFCDDDLKLDLNGIAAMARSFEKDHALALAAGWRHQPTGEKIGVSSADRRVREQRLTLFNSGRICAPELMVRRADMLKQQLWFDTNFGLGAPYGLGEECVFVTDALKMGLKGLSLPIVTGWHDGISTGGDWKDPTLMAARQQVLLRVFGAWAWMIRPIFAWRHRNQIGGKHGDWRAVLKFAFSRL